VIFEIYRELFLITTLISLLCSMSFLTIVPTAAKADDKCQVILRAPPMPMVSCIAPEKENCNVLPLAGMDYVTVCSKS
jgi:hypothetical protein